jgi:hypothetical protein
MKDQMDITIVLDKSASMAATANSTIESVNAFIMKQKQDPYPTVMNLYLFSTNVEPVFVNRPAQEVGLITPELYIPDGGSTSLLDAIGDVMDMRGTYFSSIPESERPNKVVFVVMTDGQENSSKRFTKEEIKRRIEHQTSVYSWGFIFLGADLESVKQALQYGFRARNAMNYVQTDCGIKKALADVGTVLCSAKATGSFNDAIAVSQYSQ